MTATQLEAVDQALLVISGACLRAREAAVSLRRDGAEPRLVAAAEAAQRQLIGAYNDFWRSVYLPDAGDEQLRLAG